MNKNNSTEMGNIFDYKKVAVGRYTYGTLNVQSFESNDKKLSIGSYCSIAPDVIFFLDGEHDYNKFSTYPFKKMLFNDNESLSKKDGNIVVGDDVWIGYGARIFSGVKIGQGAVIAAGAYIVKDVEPYSIVGGVPAKHIKYRFSKNVCDKLAKINLGNIDPEKMKIIFDQIYINVNEDNIDEIVDKLSKITSEVQL